MKKIIIVLLAVTLYGHNYTVHAQTAGKTYLLNVRTISSDAAAVKATRDFWKRVGDGKEEKWYKLPKGYMAEYEEQGHVPGRSVYDCRGNWVYTLLLTGEKGLPGEVRGLVKGTYYDYSIGWVREVQQEQSLVYVVHIENERQWKDIAVQDGEVKVLGEFSKSR